MNTPLDLQNNPGELERWLDRLVDGELTQDAQRQLLLALESQTDGWRRCALAFIEGQTWRREMPGLVTEKGQADDRVAATLATTSGKRRSRIAAPFWLTVAASLLVAFTLGIVSSRMWSGSDNAIGQPADSNAVAVKDPGAVDNSLAVNAVVPTESDLVSGKVQSVQVSLSGGDGQDDQSVEVPVMEGDEQKWQAMVAQHQPVLSEAELKTFENTGHEVQQHRVFYPVKLDDGRQAVVPMDIVEVRNTGGWQ